MLPVDLDRIEEETTLQGLYENEMNGKQITLSDIEQFKIYRALDQEPLAKKARHSFECEPCDKKYTEKRALVRHRQTDEHRERVGLPPAEKYSCVVCQKPFTRDFDRARHENEQHRGFKRQGIKMEIVPQPVLLQQDISPDASSSILVATVGHSQHKPEITSSVMLHDHPRLDRTTSDRSTKNISADSATNSAIDLSYLGLAAGTSSGVQGFGTDEVWNPRIHTHKSIIHRNGRSKVLAPPADLFCAFCNLPFEDMLDDLLIHLRRHLQVLQGSHACIECQIEFVHLEDLEVHRASAFKGHCGVDFPHKSPCTGHHPPNADDLRNDISDWDSFRLCTQLRHWEQGQLEAYITSILDLTSLRNQKEVDSYSIEVLFRQSCE